MVQKQPPKQERRLFERISFIRKTVLFSGSNAWACQMIDLSLKGVLITKPDDWPGKINEIFRLSISLSSSPNISMSIEVAHIDVKTIGAKWNKIDMDSFISLKRILELNSTDKHRLTKEMTYLEP